LKPLQLKLILKPLQLIFDETKSEWFSDVHRLTKKIEVRRESTTEVMAKLHWVTQNRLLRVRLDCCFFFTLVYLHAMICKAKPTCPLQLSFCIASLGMSFDWISGFLVWNQVILSKYRSLPLLNKCSGFMMCICLCCCKL
jgi:hypothetical protein